MNDLISIIIPVYNVEKYLKECLESVINQTYTNLEIILVDDGSTDSSGNICDEYKKRDTRIKVIHKENGGVSIARNLGLNNANGQYIGFIDSDDYVEPKYCEKLLKSIKENNVQCALCKFDKVYEKKNQNTIFESNYIMDKNDLIMEILDVQKGFGFCTQKLWTKNALVDIKYNENIKVGEDSLFCIESCKNIYKVYVLNEKLYHYRLNENSLVRKYDENYAQKYLRAMQETKKYIEENHNKPDIIKKFNNYIVYNILIIVINYCFNRNNKMSIIKQIEELKKVCKIPEFKYAIKNCDYNGFSLTRKITIFTLKYKLYFITMLIGKIRQLQLK